MCMRRVDTDYVRGEIMCKASSTNQRVEIHVKTELSECPVHALVINMTLNVEEKNHNNNSYNNEGTGRYKRMVD